MSELTIHHYGLATGNIEESMNAFRQLNYEVGEVIIDPVQKVKLSFIKPPLGPSIELVCDLDKNGPTEKIIGKSGCGFYHVCFEVDDIKQAIKDFQEKEYQLMRKPVPAVAFEGRPIAWLYHQHIGVVELVEKA